MVFERTGLEKNEIERRNSLDNFGAEERFRNSAAAILAYERISGESLDIPKDADEFQKAEIIRGTLNRLEEPLSGGSDFLQESKIVALRVVLNQLLSEIDKTLEDPNKDA